MSALLFNDIFSAHGSIDESFACVTPSFHRSVSKFTIPGCTGIRLLVRGRERKGGLRSVSALSTKRLTKRYFRNNREMYRKSDFQC